MDVSLNLWTQWSDLQEGEIEDNFEDYVTGLPWLSPLDRDKEDRM